MMPLYLFSFTLDTPYSPFYHESHVLELDEFSGMEAIEDLRVRLGQEFGRDTSVILNWELLPDADSHPSAATGSYSYYVSFAYARANGVGTSYYEILRDNPIISVAALRDAERYIRTAGNRYHQVRLITCKPLPGPSANLLERHRRADKLTGNGDPQP
jgi:hypothetical protein